MAKQKKLEKAAAQAMEAAEEAVAEAKKAAEKLDAKKAKKRARELEQQLADLAGRSGASGAAEGSGAAGGSGDAEGSGDRRDASEGADLTPPLPSVRDDTVEDTAEYAGSATTSTPHDPALDRLTVQALRDAARARGLRNVTHLTKGQLIERLSE
ncbi:MULTISPECIES: hypothetical protein [unclassified Leifsonia]|uniref:hypothetical protein n=1 Tax=unclassified Leifsonia TaxID=2663824 RepID=UPI000B7EB51B|nr:MULTISPECIES: hypothetical protein [unclassified Leifsonia]